MFILFLPFCLSQNLELEALDANRRLILNDISRNVTEPTIIPIAINNTETNPQQLMPETTQLIPEPINSTEGEEQKIRSHDPVGASALFVIGLITTSLNLVSCGYLFAKMVRIGKIAGYHSSIRIIMYSLISDGLVGLFFTISIVYSSIYDELINGYGCQAIGFMLVSSIFVPRGADVRPHTNITRAIGDRTGEPQSPPPT